MFVHFSFEAEPFLIFDKMSLSYVLSMFLNFQESEPQRSYKHGSYKKKSVYTVNDLCLFK